MNTMLESTLQVLDKRKKELPDSKDTKFLVDYFESGCLCIDGGDLIVPNNETDEVKALYYLMWCGCNRHSDYYEVIKNV